MTLVPALVVLVLAVWHVAVTAWATVEAEAAARAAARAALAGAAPRPAALGALPGSMRAGAGVVVSRGRVVVAVDVPAALPGFAARASASATLVRQ